MKFENLISGHLSFLFIIGYFCLASWLTLLFSSVTPFYGEVGEMAKKIPLSTILLASPLAVIVGILFDALRCAINKHLLKRSIYDLASLPDETKQALTNVISELFPALESSKCLEEAPFTNAKAGLLPDFDEYSIKNRWLHDFLDATVYLGAISLVLLSMRVMIHSLRGIDVYVFLIMIVAVFFAGLSLKDLKAEYTKAIVAIVLRESRGKNGV